VIDPKRRQAAQVRVAASGPLLDEAGNEIKIAGMDTLSEHHLPDGSIIDGERRSGRAGRRRLARIPQEESSKTRDITGGLPRVAELFEARIPERCRHPG